MSDSAFTDDAQVPAAYGGPGWLPRPSSLAEEVASPEGRIWAGLSLSDEWSTLVAVLLHRPGPELDVAGDPNQALMLQAAELALTRVQHDVLAETYRRSGVAVHYVDPPVTPPPNQMFAADLFFMTPEGAILSRPASTVRAGEERWVARRLADLGVPILRSVRGSGTFEGADAMWLDPKSLLLGRGLRTNDEGAAQVKYILEEMGVEVIVTEQPFGTMHLMGQLRFADRDLAFVWPGRLGMAAVEALKARGIRIRLIPDETEARRTGALNFVTLGPGRILMAAGNPNTQAYYQSLGIWCETVAVDELLKAAGGIGCLSGVLSRRGAD
jgi:arginine deiminase